MEVKYNVYQKGVYTGDLIKVTSDSIEFQPILPAVYNYGVSIKGG